MDISIRINKLVNNQTRTKALMTVTLGGMFTFHGAKLLQREDDDAWYVGMPGKLDGDGVFRDIVHPISRDARKLLEDKALEAYRAYIQL